MTSTPVTATDPVGLLKDLIACPSVTPTDAGVLDVVAGVLAPHGFEITRRTFEGDGSYPVDNLFAVRKGGPRTLLFCGHTDVVPPGDPADWTSDPFTPREADGKIFGRGAADMKSGVAAFLAAATQAASDGTADGATIAIAITNDEEADSVNGIDKLMTWATDAGHAFDFAIVGEPSSAKVLGDSIKIGRRGSISGTITVEGVQGHSAYPERANNPLPVLAAIVTALKAEPIDGGTAHFPATNIEVTSIDVGNPAFNVIPRRGTLKFNIRHNDLWTADSLFAWVEARMESVSAHECTVTMARHGRPSNAFISPLGSDVERLGDVVAELTGRRPEHATFGGTSDARFIARYCPVVECGLVGTSMHQTDEHVAIADLVGLTAIYHRFIGRFGEASAA
jgi:succinyl-diaminopimelate desuccinylase